MNAAEDRLSELMDAATRALHPPVDAILAEGERLGRSRRRRRRTAVATGTAAVMLLAGAGAAAGLRLTRTAQYDAADAAHVLHRPSTAPTGSATLTPPASGDATPSPAPTARTPAAALAPITATAAVNILRMKVSAAWKYGTYSQSSSGMSLLSVDVDDGKGLARVFVAIGRTKQSGLDPIDCKLQASLLANGGKRPTGAPPTSCVVQHYPNGDVVMQEVLQADPYGEYQYRIIADRADGIAMEITAANGDWSAASTEVTRITPPLNVAQWTAVALDPIWQLEVSAKLTK
jgi:hypothetical protein